MTASVIVDAGFIVAALAHRDRHHEWALAQAGRLPPPWTTCEAVFSEAFYLLGPVGMPALIKLFRRGAFIFPFRLDEGAEKVFKLMDKYADVPMSFADACLVRMTETLADPMLLTTDADFHIYRRHGRQSVPCVIPD